MTDTATTAPTGGFPKAPRDGYLSAALLAVLATAGFFYVNIMALIVDGLVEGLGFSEDQAGVVGSVNIYGASFGALAAVFLASRVSWRPFSVMLLLVLIAIDLASMFISDVTIMTGVRAAHGFAGGLLTGIAFSVMARTASADKSFGVLVFFQFGAAGVAIYLLPPIIADVGASVLFLTLAGLSVVALVMLPFIPDYPTGRVAKPAVEAGVKWTPLALTLGAIFVFQAANMALLAYIFRLGRGFGLDGTYVGLALAIATWVALLGPAIVAVLGERFGRFPLLLGAMALTLGGTAIFHLSAQPWAYLVANCGTGIVWGVVIAYLLAMASEFDKAGRMAALGGFMSKLGLATGPLLASRLFSDDAVERLGGGEAVLHLLINATLIGLAVSALLMLVPAWNLDRVRARAKTQQETAP